MRKLQIAIFLTIFLIIKVSSQTIELSGHSNFDSITGFELSTNIELTDKLEIQPGLGMNYYYDENRYESENSVSILEVRDGFFTFGSGIYYKLHSTEKFKVTAGPKLDMIYYPKESSFFGSDNVLSPSELRFYTGVNATFKHNLGNKIGYKVLVEYGYFTKSNLEAGIDYSENFHGRLYDGLAMFKTGIGVFYLFN